MTLVGNPRTARIVPVSARHPWRGRCRYWQAALLSADLYPSARSLGLALACKSNTRTGSVPIERAETLGALLGLTADESIDGLGQLISAGWIDSDNVMILPSEAWR